MSRRAAEKWKFNDAAQDRGGVHSLGKRALFRASPAVRAAAKLGRGGVALDMEA